MSRRYPNLNPQKGLIWRIVHRDNLPWILDNGLHCGNGSVRSHGWVNIGNPELIDKRANHPVPEVSPHFILPDQALVASRCGRRCAHGARFKVTKPEKGDTHARQRSIAEVPVRLTVWHARITTTQLAPRG
ncbi:DarT ssDNA thymidine ADP-ribosyltransferase family protein [Xanthomonas oryzae]|uniref:DarT ssDNA thymidine ADP-ribosyltransferase family protein n=1 Tax=Xanthomonas oryzae TaxID=347 RepID=UPI001931006C